MKKPTLFEVMRAALYIGLVGYGGPAILAPMKKIVVHEKGWISEDEFMHHLSLAQILPGAIGVTLMGSIGYKLNRSWGGIIMPLAFAFPAMAAITLLAWAYFAYGNLTFVHAIFMGLGALVVALLAHATIQLGKSIFKKTDPGMLIALGAFGASFFGHWNVVLILLTCGLLGFFIFYFDKSIEPDTPIDTVTVETGICEKAAWLNYLPLLVFTGFLIVVFIAIPNTWVLFGKFIQIGMLAFGGGFASIPLLQNMVVEKMHWVNLTIFRDGIALGQITPGPVLITAAFIGYKVSGVIGAMTATIGIFTPGVAAAIALSGTHAKIKNAKPIRAIIKGFSSGFIGLILAVALQFAIHSLINWQTWVVFLICMLYLWWGKRDTLWLILGTIGVSLFLF